MPSRSSLRNVLRRARRLEIRSSSLNVLLNPPRPGNHWLSHSFHSVPNMFGSFATCCIIALLSPSILVIISGALLTSFHSSLDGESSRLPLHVATS